MALTNNTAGTFSFTYLLEYLFLILWDVFSFILGHVSRNFFEAKSKRAGTHTRSHMGALLLVPTHTSATPECYRSYTLKLLHKQFRDWNEMNPVRRHRAGSTLSRNRISSLGMAKEVLVQSEYGIQRSH